MGAERQREGRCIRLRICTITSNLTQKNGACCGSSIADTRDLFGGFSSTVPVNSSGSVAFFSGLKDRGVGIFTGNGGSITTIAIAGSSNPLTFGFSGIALNDMGTVAFPSGVKGGGVGVFTGNGRSITTIRHLKVPDR